MKFEEAIIELQKGKKLKRKSWDINYIGFSLKFNKDNTQYIGIQRECDVYTSHHSFSIEDFQSDDWEVIEEPGKTLDQVIEEFKNGKSIRRKSYPKTAYNKLFYTLIDIEDLLESDWEVIE